MNEDTDSSLEDILTIPLSKGQNWSKEEMKMR